MITDYSDHPRKLVTLNPKLNRRRWTLPASFPLVGRLPQAAWPERLLSESQDAVALQQIGERMLDGDFDRGDIRQGNRPLQQYLGLPGALVMVSSSIRLTAWIAKFKEAGGTVKERLMYEQSHRDYLRSGYLHHRLPVMGC